MSNTDILTTKVEFNPATKRTVYTVLQNGEKVHAASSNRKAIYPFGKLARTSTGMLFIAQLSNNNKMGVFGHSEIVAVVEFKA